MMEERKWAFLFGSGPSMGRDFFFAGGEVAQVQQPEQIPAAHTALALMNEKWGGGTVAGTITFTRPGPESEAEIVLFYDVTSGGFIVAGMGGNGFQYSVRQWQGQWHLLKGVGDKRNIAAEKPYRIEISIRGSRLLFVADGIDVLSVELMSPLPQSQVGIWCASRTALRVTDIEVSPTRPTAFVIMQFSSPFNELYASVIRSVCEEFHLQAVRADDQFGPGLLIRDIERQIAEAAIVIADVSPPNPNVYYEVGYSHALNKDTILLADRSTKLPFDLSAFRTLFYENSIDGKSKLEDGLRKHLRAIVAQTYLSGGVG